MTDPPDAFTVPAPRDPTTDVTGPTIDQLADVERARRDLADHAETLVVCPNCEYCACCAGLHVVSPEFADAWRRTIASENAPP